MFVWSLSLYNIIEFKVPFFYAKSRTCSFIVSNLSGFAVASEGLEKTIAITWGATYGVGAGGIAASVSRGLSMETAETKRQVKNVPHEKKVGQGRHFNGRTGTSFKFSIWKTATGSLEKRPHKTYIPLRARTV